MPTIHDFGPCKIYMYFGDHGRPYYHIVGPDFTAKVLIEIGEMVSEKGDTRKNSSHIKYAIAWARISKDDLTRFWRKFSDQ